MKLNKILLLIIICCGGLFFTSKNCLADNGPITLYPVNLSHFSGSLPGAKGIGQRIVFATSTKITALSFRILNADASTYYYQICSSPDCSTILTQSVSSTANPDDWQKLSLITNLDVNAATTYYVYVINSGTHQMWIDNTSNLVDNTYYPVGTLWNNAYDGMYCLRYYYQPSTVITATTNNPGGIYWYAYLSIFCSIWFAALLFIVFSFSFSIIIIIVKKIINPIQW